MATNLRISLTIIKIKKRAYFENIKYSRMRNEIQSTFSTSKSKNVRTAKRKKKKGGGGRKRKAGDSRERNLTNVFDRWTDGFSCEFSWSAIKGRFSSARLAPLLPDGGGRLFLRSALKGNITNSAALRPRRTRAAGLFIRIALPIFPEELLGDTGLFLVSTSPQSFRFFHPFPPPSSPPSAPLSPRNVF